MDDETTYPGNTKQLLSTGAAALLLAALFYAAYCLLP